MAVGSTPDLSALAAYGGKYEKKLFATLKNSLDVAQDVTLIQDVRGKLNLTKLVVKAGVRPYSETFHGAVTDNLVYKPRTLLTHLAKRDIRINPILYRSTWMSEVMSGGINPQEIPFAAFVWAEVMKAFSAEINDSAAYLGVYNSAGTTAAAIADGFGTIIAAEITASTITPETTGAITIADAYDQFTAMWRSLSVAQQKVGANIYCSYGSMYKLADSVENSVSKYTEIDVATGDIFLKKTNRKCKVTPVTWMGTSERLIATPKENMIMGTDMLSDLNKIVSTPYLEVLDSRIFFELGFQIRDLDPAVFKVNEQA